MCVIIDTCTLSKVFNPEDALHPDFAPVLDWIVNGCGKIIFGGSKYRTELERANRYRKILGEFKRARKAVKLDDEIVDATQKKLEEKVVHRDFDDPHLVAMVIHSGCRIVCTCERRAIPFLRRPDLYPSPVKRPKIYTNPRNSTLLCSHNIAEICSPSTKLNKSNRELLTSVLHST
jgi:hypothetical protein